MTEVFPTRPCVGCGLIDDHPRVVSVVPTAEGAHGTELWHHDCFSTAHSDRVDHAAIHHIAGTGLKGDALRKWINKLPAQDNHIPTED
jgi:hypothetical protein